MNEFRKRLANLITIKSIITIAATFAFVYLSLTGIIPVELFMSIYTMIIGFYFGTQAKKEG